MGDSVKASPQKAEDSWQEEIPAFFISLKKLFSSMPLFKINQQLELIKETSFKFEREIQKLTEQNLKLLLHLDFIRSEFALNNFRIDTLAFNPEAKAFVIIEYKRDKTFIIIDQGYAYLTLMPNNKAGFILEYNECSANGLKRSDVG